LASSQCAVCAAFPSPYLLRYSDEAGHTWLTRAGGWSRSPLPHLPFGGLGAVAVNSVGAAVFADVPAPKGKDADDVQVGTLAAGGSGPQRRANNGTAVGLNGQVAKVVRRDVVDMQPRLDAPG